MSTTEGVLDTVGPTGKNSLENGGSPMWMIAKQELSTPQIKVGLTATAWPSEEEVQEDIPPSLP